MVNFSSFMAMLNRLVGSAAAMQSPRPRGLYGMIRVIGDIQQNGRTVFTKNGRALKAMRVQWRYGGKYAPALVKTLAAQRGVGSPSQRKFYQAMIDAGVPAETAGKCVKHKYGQGQSRGHWTQYLTPTLRAAGVLNWDLMPDGRYPA